MDAYFSEYKTTSSGLPVFESSKDFIAEVELSRCPDLSIYFGDEKTLRNGKCILTNFRILWTLKSKRLEFPLEHISKLDTSSSLFKSPKILVYLKDLHEKLEKSDKVKVIPPPAPGYIKLSFHTGGSDHFYKCLQETLKTRAWIPLNIDKRKESHGVFSTRDAGIKGLLSGMKREQKEADSALKAAFEDIDSLMNNARQIVVLSERYAASLESKRNSTALNNEDKEFSSILSDLGISNPVLKEVAGNAYQDQLAREVSDFISPIIKKSGGILLLIDVYCMVNRARGQELISPDDLLQACRLFEKLKLGLILYKFGSGVLALKSLDHSDVATSKKLVEAVEEKGSVSALEVSQKMGWSIVLAKENLVRAEELLYLCRDETLNGLRFYKNLFAGK